MGSALTTMLNGFLYKTKPFRTRKCAKRIVLILALGSVLSLLQAWGALLLYTINTIDLPNFIVTGTLFESGWKNRVVYGVLGMSESSSRGKGPIDQEGYAWWYFLDKYKYNIKTNLSANATMTESTMPWQRFNQGFELQRRPPSWSVSSKLPTDREKDRSNAMAVYELTAGWPMTSWWGAAYEGGTESYRARLSWSFLMVRQAGGNAIIYPYQPMRGLLINAIVLGVPVYFSGFFLKWGFKMVRRYRRRNRGLCPHCAYDITGLTTCPECGQPVTPKA